MIKAVVFDLDRTLLNTIQDLANAANHALRTLGLPEHTTEEFLHFVGVGRRNMVLRMLPEALRADEAMVARASGLFDEHYNAHLRDCTAPYPGIPELLAALKAKGLRLGVVSNKPHEFVTQIIEGYFPGLFDSVAGQQGGCIKPDPSGVKQVIDAFGLHPDQVLYVGDSAVDIETAHPHRLPQPGRGLQPRPGPFYRGGDGRLSGGRILLFVHRQRGGHRRLRGAAASDGVCGDEYAEKEKGVIAWRTNALKRSIPKG